MRASKEHRPLIFVSSFQIGTVRAALPQPPNSAELVPINYALKVADRFPNCSLLTRAYSKRPVPVPEVACYGGNGDAHRVGQRLTKFLDAELR